MGRKKLLMYLVISCVLSMLLLTSCGGNDPSEEDVRNVYNQNAQCYSKSQLSVDERFGLADPEGPSVGCGNADAVGDVWVYALRYNESDPNWEKSQEELWEKVGEDCEKLQASAWGNKWELFDDGTKVVPESEERVYIMICGWTETSGGQNTNLKNTANGNEYQPRVANLEISSRLGFGTMLGPACGAYTNGWYYSGNLDGGMQGYCVQYYEASGSVESCNDNMTICINIDYEIGIPEKTCNDNGLCDVPWENENTCGDCRINCQQRATNLPPGSVSFEQLIASNKDDILACQGDLNSPGYLSTSFICKMCPKTHALGPYLPGREWLPNSWAYPYSMPQGSYSTTDDNVAWGCVNVAEGSPFNCGVCGFKDLLPDETIENSIDYLAGGFCAATLGTNPTFCADRPNPGRWEYHCVPPDEVRADPSSSPWFGKYYANPSYFYTTEQVGSGWKSTVTAITCAPPDEGDGSNPPDGDGPPIPGGCFLAGTLVSMKDGSFKKIEEVLVGDEVKSYDADSGLVRAGVVANLFHHSPEDMSGTYLIINKNLRVTPNHRVFTKRGLVEAGTLVVGDLWINEAGGLTRVEDIQVVGASVPVFNLEIQPYHTYYANGLAVHNAKEQPQE